MAIAQELDCAVHLGRDGVGRQVPLADVVDRISGPDQRLSVAVPIQQLPVENAIEIAPVDQQAMVVDI